MIQAQTAFRLALQQAAAAQLRNTGNTAAPGNAVASTILQVVHAAPLKAGVVKVYDKIVEPGRQTHDGSSCYRFR
jgi:hypothetical protein